MHQPNGSSQAPDYSVIFSQVRSAGVSGTAEIVRQISQQAETIRMIAQATEAQPATHVVTYLSS